VNTSIRALALSDIDEADRILSSAFRTSDSRRTELQHYLTLQPNGWFAAECDGKLTGTVGAVNFGEFAYLGMMAVDPPMQRRGIARALMQHALAWLDARACSIVLLDASVYGAPLYASLGFVAEGQALVFQNDSPKPFTNLPEGVSRLCEKDVPTLVEFDTLIFGAERADVFKAYLADLTDRAFVARDARGNITGFVFAQSNRIGPWVAKDQDTADKLIRAALSVGYKPLVRILVPSPNVSAGDLLTRYGFQFFRAQTHMRRGKAYPARQRELIYGQASFAIG
jgi:predicted N-acetyltransferase YhbS